MTYLLDLYAHLDGGYVTEPDGCVYDTPTELLHSGLLGFCDCGQPEANLLYVLGGLALIDERGPDDRDAWHAWYEEHKVRELAHFGSHRAAMFFYYWCAEKPADLTEHGGGVPGWLTEKGRRLLMLLREWDQLPKKGI